jgi:transposase InsO family protein
VAVAGHRDGHRVAARGRVALAEHLRTDLVADALTNAVAARDPAPGVILQADRGCQYTSGDYARLAAISR